MAKKFEDTLRSMIQKKEKEIYINWINIPIGAIKRNKDVVSDLRKELRVAGYKRDTETNAPQEVYTLES